MNDSVNLAGLPGLLSEYSKEIQQLLVEQQQRDEQKQQDHTRNPHYSAAHQTTLKYQ